MSDKATTATEPGAPSSTLSTAQARALGLSLLHACWANNDSAVSSMLAQEPEHLFFATALDMATRPQAGAPGKAATVVHTPLHMAVQHNNAAMLDQLLGAGVSPNTRNLADNGSTPLLLAARLGNRDLMQVLLDHEAQVAMGDFHGVTPLHAAVEAQHLECAEALLDARAPANAQNLDGVTPLHLAVESGFQAGAALLLARGAAPNVPDLAGDTPLHYAVRAGLDTERLAAAQAEVELSRPPLLDSHEGLWELVVARGGRDDVPNEDDETPLQLALSCAPAAVH